jgi:hypothetical protein
MSDFSHIHDVKTSHRVIIEHINHDPPGKDITAKLNEEFVVLENEGTDGLSSRLDLEGRDYYRGETTRLRVSANSLLLTQGEGVSSHTLEKIISRKANRRNGTCTGEGTASSGTMKGTPPHSSTLKETR